MARKSLTKQQRINRQYREQVRRIERNYRDIEMRGGSFSLSVQDIIKPVAKPTEATIRRLRKITKDSLYRQARTETGQSGWQIKLGRQESAQLKSAITKHRRKLARAEYGDYYNIATKQEKQQMEESAYNDWRFNINKRYKEIVEQEQIIPEEPWQEDYNKDETRILQEEDWYSDYIQEEEIPEPDYEPSALPDNNYIADVTDLPLPSPTYTPEPIYSADTIPSGDEEAFYFALDDIIETQLSENQDKSYARALLNDYSELKDRLSTDEFMEWMRRNGREFSKLVEEVVNYEPSVLDKGNQLSKFNKAMNTLNDGITPLDKFDSYYSPEEEDYDEDYDEEETDDGYVELLDTVDGDIIKGKQETYLSKIDKWGKQYYNTRWVDEYGMTLDVGYKRSHYVPISEIRNIEDYLR